MRFLCDDWLVDVATGYAGKATLIAAALSVIERSLLPDRPVFWVTAGRRSGGKTTTLIMLLVAVTGIRPAAAAWSSNEEERRKALFAYLLEGAPYIIWDNITRGTQISCPHIEKSCTSAIYSDRKLGVSEAIATSAATLNFFTGNNVGPKGDLASRSLTIRLDVDRHDPENRDFKYPDPVGWTEAHRGKILQALYTILLGNPAFAGGAHSAAPVQTRFKTWWGLVGQAVEFAAKQHKEHVAGLVMDAHPTCPPVAISFKNIFLDQEDDDEETASLVDVLTILANHWAQPERGKNYFYAADVAKLVNHNGDAVAEDTRERAMTVREFLFPHIPAAAVISSKSAGKRLRRHVDEPVRSSDGQTLILRSWFDTNTKIWRFYVVCKNAA
jgi:hypothetical protein